MGIDKETNFEMPLKVDFFVHSIIFDQGSNLCPVLDFFSWKGFMRDAIRYFPPCDALEFSIHLTNVEKIRF